MNKDLTPEEKIRSLDKIGWIAGAIFLVGALVVLLPGLVNGLQPMHFLTFRYCPLAPS